MKSLLRIDGYKLDHRRQYPNGTTGVYSNITPRSSRVEGQTMVGVVGIQRFLQKWWMDDLMPFFSLASPEKFCQDYSRRVNAYLGPNTIGTEHIAALHTLGYLPLEVRALPEGTYAPLRIPVLTVENTHPDFFWLPNYYETLLSCELWGPMTSMTTAGRFRVLLDEWAAETGVAPEFVDYQGHDFSMRGMFGVGAAELSGMGHLVHFKGTDTMPAIEEVDNYYGISEEERTPLEQIGNSVAATEHSVMCAGGKDGEFETIMRLLNLYPAGILSVVSDTWDLWHVIDVIMRRPEVKNAIMARDGKYVVRPDSGDPVKIICGDPDAPADSPARKGVVELLWDIFGGTTTSTGYKMLDPHVGGIYGDAINYERAGAILYGLHQKGFASNSFVLGMGSYTYQYVTRDTYGFAMKATWARINDEPVDMFKKPVTDDGTKNSATGRLAVIPDFDTGMTLIERAQPWQEEASLLQPVWRNGYFLRQQSWSSVRKNAAEGRVPGAISRRLRRSS